MEEYEIERRREELQEGRLRAIDDSREPLLEAIDHWAAAKKIEGFFDDTERRAVQLSEDESTAILERVRDARQPVSASDALQRLRDWKLPDER